MVKTKSLEATRRKWEASHGRVAQAYAEGVAGVSGFKEAALRGQRLYEERMQDANVLARRAKGLERISDEDWKRAAREKGASRIAPGMAAAKEKYAKGMGRVLSALNEVNLPDRTADPVANVQNRVIPIVKRLSQLKNE